MNLAMEYDMEYIETSAKNNINIHELMIMSMEAIYKRHCEDSIRMKSIALSRH